MRQLYSTSTQPQIRYFYLPSTNGKSAEIIQVLNSTSLSIQIPVPEEDIELYYFFQRKMTRYEIASFGDSPAWRIFTCWNELEADHLKYHVIHDTIAQLLMHKDNKALYKQHSAVA